MKVVVSQGRCQGHGQCAWAAPDVYTLDDDGYTQSDGLEVAPEHESSAERGASACPERAISLVTDGPQG
jgi:ferredoxin